MNLSYLREFLFFFHDSRKCDNFVLTFIINHQQFINIVNDALVNTR